MKKSFILITISLIFFPLTLSAQKSFTDGFIITNSNDTVYCRVAYRLDTIKGDLCRTLINGEETDYYSSQIKGFGYQNGKFYMSGIIDNGFAELLLDGEMRLFKHEDYYVQKSGGKLYKLTSKKSEVIKDGIRYLVHDNRWRGILIFLTNDSDTDFDVVNKMDFNEKEILDFIDNYNNRNNLTASEPRELPVKSKVDYGLLPGAGLTVLNFETDNNVFEYLDDDYCSFSPSVGLYFTVTLPLLSERLSFQTELYLIRSSFSSLVIVNKETGGLYYYDTSIRFSTVSVPISLRYLLNKSDYQIYLAGGLSYNLNLDPRTSGVTEKVIDGVVTTEETPGFLINRKQYGLCGGFEIIKPLKHFNIGASLKYNHASDFSATYRLSSGINRISFSILLLK